MSSYQPVKYQSHLALDDVDLPPSSEWEAPKTCWCFVRVAEGQGYWLDVGEAREVNTGDVLVLPPSCSGLFRSSQLSAVRLAYFRFCPEVMSGLLTMAERHYFDKLAGKEGRAPRLLPASHQVAKQFSELCGESRARNVLLVRCEMLQIVGHALAREIAPASRSETATLSATKRIRVLLENLTEEEFLNASAEELAAYCGCSLRHFSRLFLQHFGVSLRSRQTETRLLKARRLIGETDSRVMTVAATCGYRHLGVFNGLFKKRFGMTPTEWRRAARDTSNGDIVCTTLGESLSPAPSHGRKAQGGNGAVVT